MKMADLSFDEVEIPKRTRKGSARDAGPNPVYDAALTLFTTDGTGFRAVSKSKTVPGESDRKANAELNQILNMIARAGKRLGSRATLAHEVTDNGDATVTVRFWLKAKVVRTAKSEPTV
jgi:hypothetical protein